MFSKYKIKEKAWTIWGAYEIYDANESLIYEVKGEAFSFRSKYIMRDELGTAICEIRRPFLSMNRKFFISMDGEDIFRIERSWNIFKPEIFVDSLNEADAFYIQGNIWQKEFAFYRSDEEFAYVSKKMWSFKDTYGVAIREGENRVAVLALVVIIDLIDNARKRG